MTAYRQTLLGLAKEIATIEGITDDKPENYSNNDLRHMLVMYPSTEQKWLNYLKQTAKEDCY